MRAREFIVEYGNKRPFNRRKGSMSREADYATPGSVRNRGYYDLYRASMAVAGMDKDGNMEHEPDPESWIGRDGYMGTYTEEERSMARAAFKKLGFEQGDHVAGPSLEVPETNTKSPIEPFKGYPR